VGPIQLSIRGIFDNLDHSLLPSTGKITTLDIGNNNIGSKGAFHVAEYIKKAKSVQWLNLYMNDIGDQGAERIADALKRNKSISTIDLVNPPPSSSLVCSSSFYGNLETLIIFFFQNATEDIHAV
jgi:Ran GTPase-activating protein (RanGAP) involved in mRNA processing and transport